MDPVFATRFCLELFRPFRRRVDIPLFAVFAVSADAQVPDGPGRDDGRQGAHVLPASTTGRPHGEHG